MSIEYLPLTEPSLTVSRSLDMSISVTILANKELPWSETEIAGAPVVDLQTKTTTVTITLGTKLKSAPSPHFEPVGGAIITEEDQEELIYYINV